MTYRGKQLANNKMPGGPQGTVLGMPLFLILVKKAGSAEDHRNFGGPQGTVLGMLFFSF